MRTWLLEAKAIGQRISALIEKHDKISVAVAWGDLTEVAKMLLANKAKFDSVLIGVDFSATDPDLIDRLVDVPNAFVAKNRPGTFAELIGLKNGAVAIALDSIPKRGEVTQAQFDAYVEAFTAAFAGSSRIARLGPATRLLAMKRPDFFVCVNGGNKPGLASALDFRPTMLTLDKYWEWVIQPIKQAPWYNAPRPSGRDMELWHARAAMLDAIFYAPTK